MEHHFDLDKLFQDALEIDREMRNHKEFLNMPHAYSELSYLENLKTKNEVQNLSKKLN